MQRIFWVTCTCNKSFSVDYAIRNEDVELECPHCRNKFKVEAAVKIDERWH
jgi:hypothetical protein